MLIAIRENDLAARSYGVNATRTNRACFALSGFIAAVAGVLFVHQQTGLQTGAEAGIPMTSLMYEERTIVGSLYGSGTPRADILKLVDLYRGKKIKLDELLTRTYPLAQINEAYDALGRGEVLRSVVTFAH